MALDWSWQQLLLAACVFLVSALGTSAAVSAFLVAIPADHFVRDGRWLADRVTSRPARILLTVGKNALGALLVILGVLLALPGVPGQGLLTILVGVMLLDLPGKRALVLRLIARPLVLRNVNRLRARFDKLPLQVET